MSLKKELFENSICSTLPHPYSNIGISPSLPSCPSRCIWTLPTWVGGESRGGNYSEAFGCFWFLLSGDSEAPADLACRDETKSGKIFLGGNIPLTAHLMSLIYFITSIWSLYPRTPVLTTLWFDEKRPTLDAMRCCHTRGSLNQSGEMSCTALRRTQSIFAQFVKVFHFPL